MMQAVKNQILHSGNVVIPTENIATASTNGMSETTIIPEWKGYVSSFSKHTRKDHMPNGSGVPYW
jgi:hypothetical protein